MRLLVVVMVLEQKVVEVYANGFIRPSKSPAGAPKQAGKSLILPEDFYWLTLAWFFTFSNADIWFAGRELVWMTYMAADNQTDRTLERRPKRRLCPRHDLRQVFRLHRYFGINDYPINLAFQVTRWHSGHCLSAMMIAFDCASEVSIT